MSQLPGGKRSLPVVIPLKFPFSGLGEARTVRPPLS